MKYILKSIESFEKSRRSFENVGQHLDNMSARNVVYERFFYDNSNSSQDKWTRGTSLVSRLGETLLFMTESCDNQLG